MRTLVPGLPAALALALRFLLALALLAILRRIARRRQVRVAAVSTQRLRKLRDLLHQHRHLPAEHRDLLLELRDSCVLRCALRLERRDASVPRGELSLQFRNALVSPIARHPPSIADLRADGKRHKIMEQSGSLTQPPLLGSSCPVNGYSRTNGYRWRRSANRHRRRTD